MHMLLSLAALAVFGLAQAQERECTPEDVTAKAALLAEKVHQLAESDPEKARQLHEELETMKLKRTPQGQEPTPQGLQDECAMYEQRIREMDRAEQRVE
jgi:biopolymer transport protein ExbB/TolQ